MTYYAHSGLKDKNINSQFYSTHINNVVNKSWENTYRVLEFSNLSDESKRFFKNIVFLSAYYHDIGKLDSNIQSYLKKNEKTNIRLLNHVDAGVAILVRKYEKTKCLEYLVSAFFVYCHHIGLQNWNEYIKEKKNIQLFQKVDVEYTIEDKIRCFLNLKEEYNININNIVCNYTNDLLDEYEKIHVNLIKYDWFSLSEKIKKIPLDSFELRMAFSCFIDADHTDTANHFSGNKFSIKFNELKPYTRIKKLNKYVETLSLKSSSDKRESRREIYNVVSKANELDHQCYLLDATVGNGKTSASLNLALRLSNNSSKKKFRIYSVAPYTNIINQTVDFYKKSVLLNKEESYNINEIHSKVELENPYFRMYNNIWNAPINVTTAVQFIESLIDGSTSSIRKLHLFANSVIIFDEYDSAMEYEKWKYVLQLLKKLSENFNTQIIFSSGSPVYYWNNQDFNIKMDVFELILQKNYEKMLEKELERVKVEYLKDPFLTISSFSQHLTENLKINNYNSVMIVLNTVRNAITITREIQNLNLDFKIYHLSSNLMPKDRKRILNKIKSSLKNNEKIILVATSIVECGIDMSFECGYRQLSSFSSTLQFNGRINREQTFSNSKTFLFDFDQFLYNNNIITENPQFRVGKKILKDFLNNSQNLKLTPAYSDYIKCQETIPQNKLNDIDNFIKNENNQNFKTNSENFKIIDSMTVTIVVDKKIIKKLERNEYVPYRTIINNSVQLWYNKLDKPEYLNNTREIITSPYGIDSQYKVWDGNYDKDLFGLET